MAQDLGTGYILIQPTTKGLGKAIAGHYKKTVVHRTRRWGIV